MEQQEVKRRALSDLEVAEAQLIENDQREDLTPPERQAAYQALLDLHGYTVDDLAVKVGKSPTAIRDVLRLALLPPVARAAMEANP